MKNKRIIAAHLLNDFSGSPLVLRQSLEVLSASFEVHLYTSTPTGNGILSDIPNVARHRIFYRWSPNKFITLIRFSWSQLVLFSTLLFALRKNDAVYVNTLLPFGAVLAGVCRGCSVVYHVHEVSIKPTALKAFLVKIAALCADEIIFVSEFVKDQFAFPAEKTHVIYNALPESFAKEAMKTVCPDKKYPFTVLMLCSMKAYKGIYQFVELGKRLPNITFKLVLNASPQQVLSFQKETDAPENCIIYPVQNNTAQFYKTAYVVVNLSVPDEWVETFGLTVLEGMYYGLPVIVPPVGGVTELVTDGVQGIYADSRDIQKLTDTLLHLYSDDTYYRKMALSAWFRAQHFSQSVFRNEIKRVFNVKQEFVESVPALEV